MLVDCFPISTCWFLFLSTHKKTLHLSFLGTVSRGMLYSDELPQKSYQQGPLPPFKELPLFAKLFPANSTVKPVCNIWENSLTFTVFLLS